MQSAQTCTRGMRGHQAAAVHVCTGQDTVLIEFNCQAIHSAALPFNEFNVAHIHIDSHTHTHHAFSFHSHCYGISILSFSPLTIDSHNWLLNTHTHIGRLVCRSRQIKLNRSHRVVVVMVVQCHRDSTMTSSTWAWCCVLSTCLFGGGGGGEEEEEDARARRLADKDTNTNDDDMGIT